MKRSKNSKSKVTMVVICFFFGIFGIHRLMLGYKNWWLMMLTLGGGLIWMLMDLIDITTGSMKMADGQDLT